MMTTDEAPRTYRSGVVVAVPATMDRAVVFDLCARLETRADRFAAGERDVIAVYGFQSAFGETALAVSHLGARATEARPDIARVLEAPVADAVRIDSYVTRGAPEAAVRAEVLLLRLARDIADAYGGLVCDDVGAIYDRYVVEVLVAEGRPRETSFAFDVAAAERVGELVPTPVPTAIALGGLEAAAAPADCAPDVALDTASIFVTMGPHVPLVTAARIAYSASTAPAIPIVVFGPNLFAGDIAVLEAAGASVATTPEELESLLRAGANATGLQRLVATTNFGRDEIALYARSDSGAESLRAFVSRRLLDVATLALDGSGGQPALAVLEADVERGNVPTRVARFAFSGAIVDLYDLDVSRAHPLILALLAARPELANALGGPVAQAIVCETIVERDDTPVAAVDAFIVSLLSERSQHARSIVQDDAGALFDASELAYLTSARRGVGASWNEKVALARFYSELP